MDLNRIVAFDIELFPNYFLLSFKHLKSKKVSSFELDREDATIDLKSKERVQNIISRRVLIGYNSNNYDIPILAMYLRGSPVEKIKSVSDHIIDNSDPGWMTMKNLKIEPLNLSHIDLMEPSPAVRIGLKLYGARMHSQRLQDLPYDPGKELTRSEMKQVLSYCENDLDTTIDLFNSMIPSLELRESIGETLKTNVMSKSDAQIAEAIFRSKLKRVSKPGAFQGTIRYPPPAYLRFKDPQLKDVISFVKSHEFELDGKGAVKLPPELKALKIELGGSVYRIGVGGLHSSESAQTIKPGAGQILVDRDVTSYYPNIILNRALYPSHIGERFLNSYREILNERIEAKRSGDRIKDAALKVAVNGSFGKLGSKWSFLYAPQLMLNVTLTGQLCLLWLIEVLERNGVRVVSANTDGFVSLVEDTKRETFDRICAKWEAKTGFNLEDTFYSALYSRDVNNYLAITPDGKAKGKGIFAETSLRKNPAGDISVLAVQEFLKNKTPIEKTINTCDDARKFILARTVRGGAVWKDRYLGRVVRWVHSKEGEAIRYKTNGNRVPKSDAAWPMMEMTKIPKHLDRSRYIEESFSILKSLGVEYVS